MTDTLPSKLTNLYGPDAASPPSLADCRGRDTRGEVERGGVGNTPFELSPRWEWSIQGNFGQVSTLQAHWRTNGLDGKAMTDLRDKLARPLIPILREASDLSVEEATVAASTLVNAQMPVVEEAIRQAVARFDEKMSVKLAKELAQANEEEL